MVKISVIIPVYNTAGYLDKCIDSILNQSFQDYEIIIINDGSTDSSEKIIEKYLRKNKKIKYYSFPNQGISLSRNYGIKVARGKYISFIDSDDYVDKDFLKMMYEEITKTNSDIAVCDYYTAYNDREELFKVKDFSSSNISKDKTLLFDINTSPWNKLYKKNLFDDLEFEKIKYEDLLLIPKLILKAKKIVKVNSPLYYYLIHDNSETTIIDKRVYDSLEILKKLNSYFKEKNVFDKYYAELEYLSIYHLMIYTIKQRYCYDKFFSSRFIDDCFDFLNREYPHWRKNKYYIKRNKFQRIIETHKTFTKIYDKMYMVKK